MSNPRLPSFAARRSTRGGFTLVELLVVIGIIAILAGVALGPITNGIKKAQQSSGLQLARTLALSEFQFATDNDGCYPDKNFVAGGGGAGNASDVAKCLLSGNYISDAGIFWIKSTSKGQQYKGIHPAAEIAQNNISWDFAGNQNFNGVNANAPDQLPVVWSESGTDPGLVAEGAKNVQTDATLPFGTQGLAICYKSNSAKFAVVTNDGTNKVQMVDGTYPGWAAYAYLQGAP